MTIFSERLRELREQKKISMAQLAVQIGVSDAAVCKWENSLSEPKASYIKALSEYFEVSTDFLIGLESDIGIKKYNFPEKNAEPLPDVQELIDLYQALEPQYKEQILEYVRYVSERRGIKRKKGGSAS